MKSIGPVIMGPGFFSRSHRSTSSDNLGFDKDIFLSWIFLKQNDAFRSFRRDLQVPDTFNLTKLKLFYCLSP